jgi:hypothetical protein
MLLYLLHHLIIISIAIKASYIVDDISLSSNFDALTLSDLNYLHIFVHILFLLFMKYSITFIILILYHPFISYFERLFNLIVLNFSTIENICLL